MGGGIVRVGEKYCWRELLFLDEPPEFQRNVREVMPQPLEDHNVTIARVSGSLSFRAAINPCPCGYFNDKSRQCICTLPMIQCYPEKISRALLDRIDIHIEVPRCNTQNFVAERRQRDRPRFASAYWLRASGSASAARRSTECTDDDPADSRMLRTRDGCRTAARAPCSSRD